MPSDVQELVQLGGTVVTVAFFIFYLNRRDKISDEKDKRWTSTLNNYLKESIRVKKELNKSIEENAVATQRNTDVLENLESVIEKDILKRTRRIKGTIKGEVKGQVIQ